MAGNALANASAARSISRAEASRQLAEFLERVARVNADDSWLHCVGKVVVFGSYLSNQEQIGDLDGINIYGRVVGVRGLMVEVAGPIHAMSVGARVLIETGAAPVIPCEVVGFTPTRSITRQRTGFAGSGVVHDGHLVAVIIG